MRASSRTRALSREEVAAAPCRAAKHFQRGTVPMEIKRAAATFARRGPADAFTGTVWQDPIIDAPAPARIRVARVTFEPGARTAWHTHPLGQTLHVVTGVGRIQLWGGPVQEIRAGDTIWIAPDEKHWHGAGPKTSMCHFALQENLDGVHVTWLEQVTDADYAREAEA